MLQLGLFSFTIGPRDSLVDWLHVDGLVDASLLAAEALALRPRAISGQSFFISDADPINNFEFLRPLCEEMGHAFPTIQIPTWLVLHAGSLFELLYRACGIPPLLTRAVMTIPSLISAFPQPASLPLLPLLPLLLVFPLPLLLSLLSDPLFPCTSCAWQEVQKVGVTHYFSTKKAQDLLGYRPRGDSKGGCREAARDLKARSMRASSLPVLVPHLAWWLVIVGGIATLACLLATHDSRSSGGSILASIHRAGLALLPQWWIPLVRLLFRASLAAHLVEGSVAWVVSAGRRRKAFVVLGWVLQTLALGGPSLKLLLGQRPL